MKKVINSIIYSIIACFITNIFLPVSVVKAKDYKNIPSSTQIVKKEKKLNVDARSYIAMDANSKLVLAQNNSQVIMPMASTTKIITSLVALTYGDLDKKITISSRSAKVNGSTVGYKKGEVLTLRELLHGLMLRSGNDAAIAIAEGVSGTVEKFVQVMDEYATSIGLLDTHFHSPHGLDDPEHYSTAYDLAMATIKAKKYKTFNEIVGSKDIDAKKYGFSRSYHNINKILWQIPNANGVKTGYTGGAGKCLVTSVNNKGRDIIIVVLNCPNRWRETSKIYNYVNEKYEYKKFFSKGQQINFAPEGKNDIALVCKEDIIIPVKGDESYSIKTKIPKEIKDDIKKGSDVGTVNIFKKDKLIYTTSLQANNDYKVGITKKMKFFNRLFRH